MASFWTGGPHPTSNLPGYPARDFGAAGNTPVFAWDTLRVERLSGKSGYRGGGFGGFSLYLRDRFGRTYFMTHVENVRAKVGDTLRPGQQIAQVGPYGTPHVHLGYTGGDPVNTLGIKPEYLFTPGGAVAGSQVIATTARGQRLTPEQLRNIASGIASGDISPEDLPPGAKVRPTWGTIPGTSVTVRDVTEVVTSPLDAIRWLGGNWDRVLEVAAGFVLVLVGLVLMGRSLGVTRTRIELVERHLPGGTERVLEREAARAEERAFVRAAGIAGRRRARGAPAVRRRQVSLPADAPRRPRTSSVRQTDAIPF